MHEFPGPQDRIRRILDNALVDCTYASSQLEGDGAMLVLWALRTDGRRVGVRFRGVKESETTEEPAPGASLKVRSVKKEGGSVVGRLFWIFKAPELPNARVRIDAGPATLDIVCQDAEWWEE
jgi:hypothetical protein